MATLFANAQAFVRFRPPTMPDSPPSSAAKQPVGRARQALAGLLSGRQRYLRASVTLTEIATLYARWRIFNGRRPLEEVHANAGQKLATLARRNGGAWVKAAQFFSTRADILPEAWITSLQTLQNDATPIDFSQIQGVLAQGLGRNWCDYFDWIDATPVATASTAQLHRAKLKNGPEVALKVQLPGVKESFLQDMASFRLLAKYANPLVKELDLVQIVACLVDMTLEELDFRHEARNLQAFSRLPHPSYIKVPHLYDSLTREQLLVTSWEEGARLREHLDANPDNAPHLLNLLLGSYLQQVTRFGLFQADPHPGNFLVNSQGQLVIVDYGALGRLTRDEVTRYSHLLYGLMGFHGAVDIGALFIEAGFEGGTPEVLQSLAEFITTDKLKQMAPLAALEEILSSFRRHHIRIPDSYVALSRVLITLGGFMLHYNAPMDWTPPEQRLTQAPSSLHLH